MEPKRLLDVGSPTARSLLQAATRDKPGASLTPGLIAALEGAAPAQSLLAKLAGVLRRTAFSKISIGVVAVAAASGGGYVIARHRSTSREVAPLPSVSVGAPQPGVSDVVPLASASIDASAGSAKLAPERPPTLEPDIKTVPPEPPAPSHVVAPARHHAAVLAPEPTITTPDPGLTITANAKPTITDELDEIRQVRSLVLAGNGEAAVKALDAYAVSYPAGTFEEEALALRVHALRLTGDSTAAEQTLHSLESRFPNSVHLAALRP